MATSPTPITPLPTPVPQRSDPANFAARGDALMVALPSLVTETNAAGATTYNNAVEAATSAATSTSAATDAVAASSVALAAANFKGVWSSLTGVLNKPASVKHNGRFWLLLNNLANIAASEPTSSSPDWTSLDAGTKISQTILSAGTTSAIANVTYIVAATGVIVVLPAPGSQSKGDGNGIRLAIPPDGTQVLDFNGNNYLGFNAGQRHIDLASFALDVNYENTTIGYY